jgi:hypothetical protein
MNNIFKKLISSSQILISNKYKIISQTKIEEPKSPPDPDYENIKENILVLSELQGFSFSRKTGKPVAADGSPIPWYTYPAIEYFRQFDVSGLLIFEYGCGNSSLFWALKGAHLWAVEHDQQWHAAMSTQPSTLQGLMLRETRDSYAAAIHEPGKLFDLIIIDGVWRNECAIAALSRLKPQGLFILDNSDWYLDVAEFLRNRGFFQIDFNGYGPINPYCWTTSLFIPWKSPYQSRIKLPNPIGGISVSRGELW